MNEKTSCFAPFSVVNLKYFFLIAFQEFFFFLKDECNYARLSRSNYVLSCEWNYLWFCIYVILSGKRLSDIFIQDSNTYAKIATDDSVPFYQWNEVFCGKDEDIEKMSWMKNFLFCSFSVVNLQYLLLLREFGELVKIFSKIFFLKSLM